MCRLSTFAGWVLALAYCVAAAAQQPAPRSSAGKTTPVGAPQPQSSGANQPLMSGMRADVRTAIQGNALTATNGSLPDALVRLRDARSGHVLGTQITDKTGFFAFRVLDPGTYVVELMGADQTVLAASDLLNVANGEVVSAVVQMPWQITGGGGLFGRGVPSALAVLGAAAASGVMAVAVTNRPVSGER